MPAALASASVISSPCKALPSASDRSPQVAFSFSRTRRPHSSGPWSSPMGVTRLTAMVRALPTVGSPSRARMASAASSLSSTWPVASRCRVSS